MQRRGAAHPQAGGPLAGRAGGSPARYSGARPVSWQQLWLSGRGGAWRCSSEPAIWLLGPQHHWARIGWHDGAGAVPRLRRPLAALAPGSSCLAALAAGFPAPMAAPPWCATRSPAEATCLELVEVHPCGWLLGLEGRGAQGVGAAGKYQGHGQRAAGRWVGGCAAAWRAQRTPDRARVAGERAGRRPWPATREPQVEGRVVMVPPAPGPRPSPPPTPPLTKSSCSHAAAAPGKPFVAPKPKSLPYAAFCKLPAVLRCGRLAGRPRAALILHGQCREAGRVDAAGGVSAGLQAGDGHAWGLGSRVGCAAGAVLLQLFSARLLRAALDNA